MSTRSLTIIKNAKNKAFVNIYKHSDGDPECYGVDLANFLNGMVIVSGFSTDSKRVANGIECLAAQIVTYFKKGPGGVYLYPVAVKDVGEEYVYVISPDDVSKQYVKIKIFKSDEDGRREIFFGTPSEMLKFIGVKAGRYEGKS